jgi:beta-1,4-mannosyl-glycoprotein beta-1,4-N-acetylglucosaminyltransferase
MAVFSTSDNSTGFTKPPKKDLDLDLDELFKTSTNKNPVGVNKRRIFDCFLFNNEIDMLKLRLEELKDVVDIFVLVESKYTFSGKSKPLHFELVKNEFLKYNIQHITLTEPPAEDAWSNEAFQRNAPLEYLKQNMLPDDVALLCDLDEIPNSAAVQDIRNKTIPVPIYFCMDFYYYNFNWIKKTPWVRASAVTLDTLIKYDIEKIRNLQAEISNAAKPGGWHLSYFMSPESIREKIKAFSHQEWNKEQYLNLDSIIAAINSGKDLFSRGDHEDLIPWTGQMLPKNKDIFMELKNNEAHSPHNKKSMNTQHTIISVKTATSEIPIVTLQCEESVQIFDGKDNGYHPYGTQWWTNPKCPHSFKYLNIDSMYPSVYFNDPNIGHPPERVSEIIYSYMQEMYQKIFGREFNSILELGTGGGEITRQFHKHKLDYIAVEGTTAGCDRLVATGMMPERIIQTNLKLMTKLNRKFDISMCTEVAEHIEPWFASKVVTNCIEHSDVVWFSAAKGDHAAHYHHINEVPIEAWDNLFAYFGFNHYISLDGRYDRADRIYLNNDALKLVK